MRKSNFRKNNTNNNTNSSTQQALNKRSPVGYNPLITQLNPYSSSQLQNGGFAIPAAILAGVAALKSIQPFQKAKNWLSSAEILDGKRDSKIYKGFKAAADAGAALGFGKSPPSKKKKKRKTSKKNKAP